MPLSRIQKEVLRVLASHRDPESYVAGRSGQGDRKDNKQFLITRSLELIS